VAPFPISAFCFPNFCFACRILGSLGRAELRAVINKSCATGELIIPPNLMRELADGTALQPLPSKEEERTLQARCR